MQGNDFRRVSPGDPLRIPSSAYNAMLDAAEAHRALGGAGAGALAAAEYAVRVPVTNRSGSELPMWSVAGVSGHEMEGGAFDGQVFLSEGDALSVIPADERHALGNWVLLDDGCPPGGSVQGLLMGVVRAKIRVSSEEHEFADVPSQDQRDSGEHRLSSSTCGRARILWKEPGTGIKHAMLLLLPTFERMRIRAKLGVAVPLGSNPNGSEMGWAYTWSQARLDSTGISERLDRYATAGGNAAWLDDTDLVRARNRYESHLFETFGVASGEEGFVGVDVCGMPGVAPSCPPGRALYPEVRPVPRDVVVALEGERGLSGEALMTFEAMNPIAFSERVVGG